MSSITSLTTDQLIIALRVYRASDSLSDTDISRVAAIAGELTSRGVDVSQIGA